MPIIVDVETPSFTFKLERVRSIRERAEERAREAYARELELKLRGEAMVRTCMERVDQARQTRLQAATGGASGADLLAAQAWLERSQRDHAVASRELDRKEADVAVRHAALMTAARERQMIDKLAERQKADHEREWARRAQGALDEIALSVHRRRLAAA
jgi:flagellar FliJ protein